MLRWRLQKGASIRIHLRWRGVRLGGKWGIHRVWGVLLVGLFCTLDFWCKGLLINRCHNWGGSISFTYEVYNITTQNWIVSVFLLQLEHCSWLNWKVYSDRNILNWKMSSVCKSNWLTWSNLDVMLLTFTWFYLQVFGTIEKAVNHSYDEALELQTFLLVIISVRHWRELWEQSLSQWSEPVFPKGRTFQIFHFFTFKEYTESEAIGDTLERRHYLES